MVQLKRRPSRSTSRTNQPHKQRRSPSPVDESEGAEALMGLARSVFFMSQPESDSYIEDEEKRISNKRGRPKANADFDDLKKKKQKGKRKGAPSSRLKNNDDYGSTDESEDSVSSYTPVSHNRTTRHSVQQQLQKENGLDKNATTSTTSTTSTETVTSSTGSGKFSIQDIVAPTNVAPQASGHDIPTSSSSTGKRRHKRKEMNTSVYDVAPHQALEYTTPPSYYDPRMADGLDNTYYGKFNTPAVLPPPVANGSAYNNALNNNALNNFSNTLSYINQRQRSWKRCATHVAIAYYIYYQQRSMHLQQLSSSPNSVYSSKLLLPFSLDPTFEARLLKERTESMKRQNPTPCLPYQTFSPSSKILPYGPSATASNSSANLVPITAPTTSVTNSGLTVTPSVGVTTAPSTQMQAQFAQHIQTQLALLQQNNALAINGSTIPATNAPNAPLHPNMFNPFSLVFPPPTMTTSANPSAVNGNQKGSASQLGHFSGLLSLHQKSDNIPSYSVHSRPKSNKQQQDQGHEKDLPIQIDDDTPHKQEKSSSIDKKEERVSSSTSSIQSLQPLQSLHAIHSISSIQSLQYQQKIDSEEIIEEEEEPNSNESILKIDEDRNLNSNNNIINGHNSKNYNHSHHLHNSNTTHSNNHHTTTTNNTFTSSTVTDSNNNNSTSNNNNTSSSNNSNSNGSHTADPEEQTHEKLSNIATTTTAATTLQNGPVESDQKNLPQSQTEKDENNTDQNNSNLTEDDKLSKKSIPWAKLPGLSQQKTNISCITTS